MTSLTRGQVAKLLGITTEAIRFYEQQGLINPQRATNGYRKYDQDSIEKLKFIIQAKGIGLSLKDIHDLLSIKISPEQHTCQEVKNITQTKLHDIEEKILHLQRMHNALKVIHNRCCGGDHSAEHCTILTAFAETPDDPM
ncbi:Zn(2+)-responsive transcriptional regulator [Vibrio agarivorans]|uniref:Zn(2+)-responsive transcriptional regulator n=1 Tax=Vibrio agarivorans TaxID=153622 RepID=UPI00223014CD|nr:Zn(2+)-responsive transcriptional regulator [Vibrio agarivorans]